MIDFIRMVAPIEPQYPFNSIHPFEWQELIFVPKFKKGVLKGFESEYKDLRVVLYSAKQHYFVFGVADHQLVDNRHHQYQAYHFVRPIGFHLAVGVYDLVDTFFFQVQFEIKKILKSDGILGVEEPVKNVEVFRLVVEDDFHGKIPDFHYFFQVVEYFFIGYDLNTEGIDIGYFYFPDFGIELIFNECFKFLEFGMQRFTGY